MKYTIKDTTEETYCDWCGRPLYIGDRAIMAADESRVFCSGGDQRAWDLAEIESRDFDPRPACPANA